MLPRCLKKLSWLPRRTLQPAFRSSLSLPSAVHSCDLYTAQPAPQVRSLVRDPSVHPHIIWTCQVMMLPVNLHLFVFKSAHYWWLAHIPLALVRADNILSLQDLPWKQVTYISSTRPLLLAAFLDMSRGSRRANRTASACTRSFRAGSLGGIPAACMTGCAGVVLYSGIVAIAATRRTMSSCFKTVFILLFLLSGVHHA